MFRLNLFLPLIIVTLMMTFLTVSSVFYVEGKFIHKSKEGVSKQFIVNLNEKVDAEAAVISEYIDFIQKNDDVSSFFLEQNKNKLNDSVIDIYSRLNKNVNLTHMYFIKSDGTVLLRVHDYKRDRDIVERTTFKKAKESQSLFYGLEFGLKKNYTLRVVKPWIVDDKIIGYIELGKEIDKIIDELSFSLKTHIYLAVNKDVYKNIPDFVKRRLSKNVETSDYYVVYNTSNVPTEIESILNSTISQEEITLDGSEYFVSKQVLSDVSDKKLGYIVFLSDVSLEHSVMYNSIKVLSLFLFLIATITIISGYIIFSRKEKSIFRLTTRLEKQKSNLALFNVKLQKLFDLQKNILITSNGKNIITANQALFEFLGFENLDEFLEHYSCICDLFIGYEDFFHLGKVDEGENWIETIMHLPDEKRMVIMIDYELISHAFSVSVNEYEDGNYIIAFADISNTIIEHAKLKRKVTHDKLTGALNREFFDKNIELIIRETYPKKLGIILCDIDHFKDVNDTYGHNCGDIVLKEFTSVITNSIRDNDYLIRWGGEEFIILVKVNTIESLVKITENIRKLIEIHSFEEVGKITSSFGITLYSEDEDVVKTIERADKALYTAKNSGRNQSQVF